MTIQEMIEKCNSLNQSGLPHTGIILEICSALNSRIESLEADLKRTELRSKRAANIASCLANGIQPD